MFEPSLNPPEPMDHEDPGQQCAECGGLVATGELDRHERCVECQDQDECSDERLCCDCVNERMREVCGTGHGQRYDFRPETMAKGKVRS